MSLAAVRVCVGFDVFVIREGGWVALLGQLCPIGEPVGGQREPGRQRETERSTGRQRGSEGLALVGCPAPEARG
jgi:hypothetical protein